MQLDKWTARDWIFAAISVILILIALLAIYPGLETAWFWTKDNSSNIASWVQAFGSILAIWGAFQIATKQKDNQQSKEAENERIAKIKRYVYLTDRFLNCISLAKSLKDEYKNANKLKSNLSSIRSTLEVLRSIKNEEIPDSDLIFHISNIRIRIESLADEYADICENYAKNPTLQDIDHISEKLLKIEIWSFKSRNECMSRLRTISKEDELKKLDESITSLKKTSDEIKNLETKATQIKTIHSI